MVEKNSDTAVLGKKRARSPEQPSAEQHEVIDVDEDVPMKENPAEGSDCEDPGAEPKMGRPFIELMNSVILRFEINNPRVRSKIGYRCISDKCTFKRNGNPNTSRIYRHAQTCQRLRHTHPALYKKVNEEQAGTSLTEQLEAAKSSGPAPKRMKTTASGPTPSASSSGRQNESVAEFARRGAQQATLSAKQKLQLTVDRAIMLLLCNRGVPPSLVDTDEWKAVVNALNPNYAPSPSGQFTEKHIPKEAAFVNHKQRDILATSHNVTVSFDGGNTRQDGIYFVHATIPARASFFLDGHVGTDDSHTGQWIKEKLTLSIDGFGRDRVGAIVSDGASNCVLAKKMLVQEVVPLAFDLYDCCHALHGAVKKITKLPHFAWMVSLLKPILTHFSKSYHSRSLLKQSGENGETVYSLQKIGKTRFGSHYMAAKSVSDVLSNIRDLVQKSQVKFKNKKVHEMFSQRWSTDYINMDQRLAHYTSIIEPIIRSIWSLESSLANPADVFVFFAAIAAQLKELFARPESETHLPPDVVETVVNIFNDLFDDMFDPEHEIYFVAFALDPRYPIGDILLIVETAAPSITVPRRGIDYTLPHPRAYDRVKEYLKLLLRKILARVKEIRSLPAKESASLFVPEVLRDRSEAEAAALLKTQLETFWLKKYPFDAPFVGDDPVQWWTDLERHPQANVLSMLAIRLLTPLPNSMPDERTGSTFTWFNSALRGCQKAETLIDMIQIRQWYMHQSAAATPAKRPTVRFRDIKADLLKRLQSGARAADPAAQPDQDTGNEPEASSDSDDEAEEPSVEREPPSARSTPASSAPAQRLLAKQGLNLNSPRLRDLLSATPVIVDKSPASLEPVPTVEESPANWDF